MVVVNHFEGDGDGSRRRAVSTAMMLDAAEALFAARGYDAVSVRDIADQAGFSHALVHRYLGSKAGIYRKVLQRSRDELWTSVREATDLREAMALMVRLGLQHQQQVQLITRSALGPQPIDSTTTRLAATERLVELAQQQADKHRGAPGLGPGFAMAGVAALYLGWIAAEGWLLAAAGLEDLDQDAVADGLLRLMYDIVEREVPDGDGKRQA